MTAKMKRREFITLLAGGRRGRSSGKCRWSDSSAASHLLSLAAVEHGTAGGAEIAPVMGHAG